MKKLSRVGIDTYINSVSEWKVSNDNSTIEKGLKFKSFSEAIDFVNNVAEIAEEEKHHPDIEISYRNVTLKLSTHEAKGLTEKDFNLAKKIDNLLGESV